MSKETPKVSVVIAAGRKNPLYEDSLKAQDYPDYEVLAINERTAAQARNTGIKNAKGDIVAFIDDDVVLPPSWISTGVSLLIKSGADVVGGPNIGFQGASAGERISDFLISSPLLNGFRRKYRRLGPAGFYNYKNFATCNMMLRKDVFDKIGAFNESYVYVEDMEFLWRCELSGLKKYYSPEFFLYHKRRNFPHPHLRQVFNWGYWNMRMAREYNLIFKRADIWLSLLLIPALAVLLYLFFLPMLLLLAVLFPAALHFFSYSAGTAACLFSFFGRKKRVKTS